MYGVAVKKLTPLDCGVLRVDRADGSSWVARVFPPARLPASVEHDAVILRLLEKLDFPSERLAADEPISTVEDHCVLVTHFIKGKPPAGTAVAGAWQGDALGRLHAIPLTDLPPNVGGGWHGLSLNGGGRAADFALLSELLADRKRTLSKSEGKDIDALLAALAAIDRCEGLPMVLVHVDFGGPNVLKGADGSFTVVDWTGAGRGPRLESVAATLGPLPPAAQKAAIAAYRKHIELTDEELDRLEGTLLTHQLVLACWAVAVAPAQLAGISQQLPKAGAAMRACDRDAQALLRRRPMSAPAGPGPLTLASFLAAVLLGGVNFLAVRVSNEELAPLWGATLRFILAGAIFVVIALVQRTPLASRPTATGHCGLRSDGLRRFLRPPLLGARAGDRRRRRGRAGHRSSDHRAHGGRPGPGAAQGSRGDRALVVALAGIALIVFGPGEVSLPFPSAAGHAPVVGDHRREHHLEQTDFVEPSRSSPTPSECR